jgi:exodeoxyribonuclease V gamma subunit
MSQVELFPYPDFESLVGGVRQRWGARREDLGCAPVPLPVVVPSLGLADAWQRWWADAHGVCMGFSFHMPQAFVGELVRLAGGEAWHPAWLTWKIWQRWQKGQLGWSGAGASAREDWLAAAEMADLLDQYDHNRPEWMARWADGLSAWSGVEKGRWRDLEGWQRELWRDVREEMGARLSPALILRDWEAQARQSKPGGSLARLAEDFPELLVLGAGTLDPLLVRVLRCLAAAGSRVEVHVILASLDFLGEMEEPWAAGGVEIDPEELQLGVGHPLWQAQGRHTVGAFSLLSQLDEQFTHWPEVGSRRAAEGSTGLLGRLQADVRFLRPPRAETSGGQADDSLQVHGCFGPRRELEVVREELRRALIELPDLQLDEILVAATDWETYAPLVAAVFEEVEHPLPVRMMETPPGEVWPVLLAWQRLLQGAQTGEFPASALLELVQNADVQRVWDLEPGSAEAERAVETVRVWLVRSGWMKGAAGEEEELAVGSWLAAVDRLVAGAWLGDADEAVDGQGRFLFPVGECLPESGEWVNKWWEWLGEVRTTLLEWARPADPAEWAERLQNSLGPVLVVEDDMRPVLRPWLAELRAAAGCGAADAATLLAWLGTKSGQEGRRTQLTGKITFGRLRQLQHLPCRVLVVVGLGETQFPGRAQRNAWDLRAAQPRLWDRNPRIDQRQLFLDALVTPRDRLILTAPVRNVRTGVTEPFSACVEELLRTLEQMGIAREEVVKMHPLFPFATAYFLPASGVPPSFEVGAWAVARALAGTGGEKQGAPAESRGWWMKSSSENKPEPLESSLTAAELARFWKNPAKGFLQHQGVETLRIGDADEALDAPPLEVGGLDLWQIKESMWQAWQEQEDPGSAWWLCRSQADRLLPPGYLGERVRREHLHSVAGLWELWQRMADGTESVQWTSRTGITLQAEFAIQKGTGAVLSRVWKKADQVKHFWEAWVLVALTAAAGLPRGWCLLQEEAPHVVERPALAKDQAEEILEACLEGWQQGAVRPLCYAPQASEVMAKQWAEGDANAAWQAGMEAWSQPDQGYGGGEGVQAEASFVWRDCPLESERAEWLEWARRVAAPLWEWRTSRA